jgi:hypothetical protein
MHFQQMEFSQSPVRLFTVDFQLSTTNCLLLLHHLFSHVTHASPSSEQANNCDRIHDSMEKDWTAKVLGLTRKTRRQLMQDQSLIIIGKEKDNPRSQIPRLERSENCKI